MASILVDLANGRGFKFVELFCGVGGFRLGLEALGGKAVWASDVDRAARETYAKNFGYGQRPYVDIRSTDLSLVPHYHVLTAGFPCQDFTGLGPQKGLDGQSGELFYEIPKFLRAHQPELFLLENVAGLMKMEEGSTLRHVVATLAAEGYDVKYATLNSSAVLPQFRNRLYFVGVRKDLAARHTHCKNVPSFEFPILPEFDPYPSRDLGVEQAEREAFALARAKAAASGPSRSDATRTGRRRKRMAEEIALEEEKGKITDVESAEEADQCMADVNARHDGGGVLPGRVVREILEDDDDPFLEHYRVSRADWSLCRNSKATLKYGLEARFMDPYDVAHTLVSGYRLNKRQHAQFVRCAPERFSGLATRPRWLTPRECARLMGFPESFHLHPHPLDAYRQMGNAVTPPVIASLAGAMLAFITDDGVWEARGHLACLRMVTNSMPDGSARTEFFQRHACIHMREPIAESVKHALTGVLRSAPWVTSKFEKDGMRSSQFVNVRAPLSRLLAAQSRLSLGLGSCVANEKSGESSGSCGVVPVSVPVAGKPHDHDHDEAWTDREWKTILEEVLSRAVAECVGVKSIPSFFLCPVVVEAMNAKQRKRFSAQFFSSVAVSVCSARAELGSAHSGDIDRYVCTMRDAATKILDTDDKYAGIRGHMRISCVNGYLNITCDAGTVSTRTSTSTPTATASRSPTPSSTLSLSPSSDSSKSFTISEIGVFESVFREKYGTPRQSGLVPLARARFSLHASVGADAFSGLEHFSHVWLIFVFDQNTNAGFHSQVKPPRLLGEKIGVFACRSPHRLNAVGMTVARLDGVKGRTLLLSGVDLVNGTPIIDIKPYHPADCVTASQGRRCPSWVEMENVQTKGKDSVESELDTDAVADADPRTEVDADVDADGDGERQLDTKATQRTELKVEFTTDAQAALRECAKQCDFYDDAVELETALTQTLELDPRSIHSRKSNEGVYGLAFDNLEVVFRVVAADNVGTDANSISGPGLGVPKAIVCLVRLREAVKDAPRMRTAEWLKEVLKALSLQS